MIAMYHIEKFKRDGKSSIEYFEKYTKIVNWKTGKEGKSALHTFKSAGLKNKDWRSIKVNTDKN